MTEVLLPSEREALAQEAEIERQAQLIMKEQLSHVSPEDKPPIEMPALLNQRRVNYGIVDDAFRYEAVWDRVFLWQVTRAKGDTYVDGGLIKMPETAKRRVREETPRGIIVSAGLMALDHLRSQGMDLGHMVNFVRMQPWRLPVAYLAGHEFQLIVIRDGDIIASEELPHQRKCDGVKTELFEDDGDRYHVLTKHGRPLMDGRPTKPPIPSEY